MLQLQESGKRVVKIPTNVVLTSSKPAHYLFDFEKSKYHVVTSSDSNVKRIRYEIYYTYQGEDTQCALSHTVKAYPKDGKFYIMSVKFKVPGTFRLKFFDQNKQSEAIERVVEVVESDELIRNRKNEMMKKTKRKKEDDGLDHSKGKKKRRKEDISFQKKRKGSRKQKHPRPLRRRKDPPALRRNLTHLYQGFEADETALLFCKHTMKRQLFRFCMDMPYC